MFNIVSLVNVVNLRKEISVGYIIVRQGNKRYKLFAIKSKYWIEVM